MKKALKIKRNDKAIISCFLTEKMAECLEKMSDYDENDKKYFELWGEYEAYLKLKSFLLRKLGGC